MIILICTLLLLAYIFDITSSKTRVPSVILLLALGWGVSFLVSAFDIVYPDLSSILPMLGTIGLILIVLEGSLELELNASKFGIIKKTSIIALLSIIVLSLGIGYAFQYYGGTTFRIGFINAIPFAIISSAIAIPSVHHLSSKNKEFIIYESSFSDIFGVIIFNFILSNETIKSETFAIFGLNLLEILLISIGATIGLAMLLGKLKHQVKFLPIILMIVLIYDISKIYHLPALIFILLFGLFIGNLDELNRFKFIEKLKPEVLNKEVHKFKEINTEFTFLIRSLFFLLFGFLMDTSELLNSETIIWALVITLAIFLIRFILLKIFRLGTKPLLFIAPRGLITILFFISLPVSQQIAIANKSLIIQVIILCALVMMFGMLSHKVEKPEIPVQSSDGSQNELEPIEDDVAEVLI
ncbi:MAG: hypothetical protein R2774_12995 [Saprospiraceae bacterium]